MYEHLLALSLLYGALHFQMQFPIDATFDDEIQYHKNDADQYQCRYMR